jgi:serine/threonine protein kinase
MAMDANEHRQPLQEVRASIAANLTTAAHLLMLMRQLQGAPVSLPEAIAEVRDTWLRIMDDHSIRQTLLETEPIVPADTPQPRSTHTEPTYVEETNVTPITKENPLVGTVLDGRYRILRALGSGGMGEVFLAEQLNTGRKTAIKTLHTHTVTHSEPTLRFFGQEVKSLARLNHPNVAQVYDAITTGDVLYIAMEYVEGESLRSRLLREPSLGVDEVRRILREAGTGLGATHQLGIIHRDIKPENIMLLARDSGGVSVKLLDFGIAILDDRDAMDNKSGVGMIAGTPSYMSPEQIQAMQLTTSSDVYSLGVVAYEMLTGNNPFSGHSPYEVASKHVSLTPPRLSESVPDIPQEMEAAVMRALEKDPVNRFQTALEFVEALDVSS